MSNQPHVSIGMPVYNGAVYLRGTLDSLLAQSYTQFELIISDNGSTDGTEQICRAYAASDERIRYYRYDKNRGAAWNYNNVFMLATGRYFKWAAADDLCAPSLLERCVEALDCDPTAVISHTQVIDIDAQGKPIEIKKSFLKAKQTRASNRFHTVSRVHPAHKCEEIFGLIRQDVLAKTCLIENYADSDRTLLAELSLYGHFVEIEEPLFLHRMHEKSSAYNVTRQDRSAWFDPIIANKLVFPNWRQMVELAKVIQRAPLPIAERLRCYKHLIVWTKRRRKWLWDDLQWARKYLFSQARSLSVVSPSLK